MGFKQLITKVQQAETALEEKERHASAQWDQIKLEWRAAWTPGRIVLAGLASGFVTGRVQPLKSAARSGQIMQLVTMMSGLFAGGSAKVAADEAEHAAQTAENVADAVAPEAAVAHPDARGGPMGGTRAVATDLPRAPDDPLPPADEAAVRDAVAAADASAPTAGASSAPPPHRRQP